MRSLIAMTSVAIGDGVTSIGSCAFYDCDGLTSVVIPDGVTTLYDNAFAACGNLTSVFIGNGVTSISSSAFSSCPNLIYNEYENFRYLGNIDNPYYALIAVKSNNYSTYNMHENTKVIADGVFSGCSRMESVTIPDGVKAVGYNAFNNCSSLTKVTCPACAITRLPTQQLTTVVITSGSIDSYAFRGCDKLTSVTIGNGVTSIGHNAFNNCSKLIFN